MVRNLLPTTASGRFRFALAVGIGILAVAVIVFWVVPALAPVSLGGFAL